MVDGDGKDCNRNSNGNGDRNLKLPPILLPIPRPGLRLKPKPGLGPRYTMSLLLILLSILNTLDYLTTVFAVSSGAFELNPVMRDVMDSGLFANCKLCASIFFLLMGVGAVSGLEFLDEWERSGFLLTILAALVILYTVVVVNNLLVAACGG
ncbi:hypothetical protein Ferp_0590 [Ferroglobus placidus DSM 10642]|uniref:DUF5658 domain-containing protein n=1 Tax=Ferroglobus placidus (strain DSM 10642 / AEDII12DO) TaxID=589924 RepID=D3S3C9_FERPA|nr:DUF5658 family protein [Ferroglobus placidus]ADC64762.1 hypothetical protein Ferp_0590 [Ferroglobus placidus DSM 10642]